MRARSSRATCSMYCAHRSGRGCASPRRLPRRGCRKARPRAGRRRLRACPRVRHAGSPPSVLQTRGPTASRETDAPRRAPNRVTGNAVRRAPRRRGRSLPATGRSPCSSSPIIPTSAPAGIWNGARARSSLNVPVGRPLETPPGRRAPSRQIGALTADHRPAAPARSASERRSGLATAAQCRSRIPCETASPPSRARPAPRRLTAVGLRPMPPGLTALLFAHGSAFACARVRCSCSSEAAFVATGVPQCR
jgi:hypothetical protein